jgi:hypothetical protein
MDASTRDVAIKNFTYMTDYELDEDDDPQQGGGTSTTTGAGGTNGLNQKTKSILISPALIYKEKVESSSASTAPNNRNKSNHKNRQYSTIKMPSTPSSSASATLPEEELIKRQKWSCYGSTEVELLVLQNASTGEEHIAAVAPRNVGVSIRKIDADDGSITSIGIGWLNIVVDAGPAFLEEDDDDEEVERADPRGHRHRDDAKDSPSSRNQQGGAARQSSNQQRQQEGRPSEDVPPRPSQQQDSIARTRTQLKRYYEFAGKVGEQMKVNVSFLRETLQDDFARRSTAAGNKIVANLPRTLDRTAAFFHKMIDRWTGSGGGTGGGGGDSGPDL